MNVNSLYRYIYEVNFRNITNWSAGSILNNQLLYKEGFDLISIGNLISKNREKEIIQDDKSYKQVTIKLYGKGVIQRGNELTLGKNIGTKNQYKVSMGQFIMSKIDARNGAFGIVPQELTGAITTQDFLSYNINENVILPQFFVLITSSKKFNELCQQASSGTTGRQRINENTFLSFKIPVPTKDVQIRLINSYQKKIDLSLKQDNEIAKIELEIEAFIFKSLGLNKEIEQYEKKKMHIVNYKDILFWGADKILSSTSYSSLKYKVTSFESSPSLYLKIFRGKSPKYYINGKNIILNQKCNRWNKIELQHAKNVNDNWFHSINKEFLTKKGDILINSTGEGTIGRASYISQDFKNYLIDSHILLLRVNPTQINPEFIVWIINSKYGQDQINGLKSAKSTKQTELGLNNLVRIHFPLIDLNHQNEIVSHLKIQTNKISKLSESSHSNKINALNEFESEIFNSI